MNVETEFQVNPSSISLIHKAINLMAAHEYLNQTNPVVL